MLVVPEPLRAPLERAVPLTALGRIRVTALSPRERTLCAMRPLTLAALARWWTMRRHLRTSGAAHGFFLGLDLLSERLTDAKLAPHIKSVREEVKNGSLLSDAFARQGVFPPIYVTSVLAGEKSGALGEVLDRFITYQKLALAVRKKLILSLVYPCILLVLVICLMIFLITFVVPRFAPLPLLM